jgi:hypothetical protein
MAELKTKADKAKVEDFLEGLSDKQQKHDSYQILKMMQDITGEEAAMWGGSMVGFGQYHYRYASGHEGDTFIVGFSPRKSAITLYLMCQAEEQADLLKKLGKHKMGKGCLYIIRLDEVNPEILKEIIQRAVNRIKKAFNIKQAYS